MWEIDKTHTYLKYKTGDERGSYILFFTDDDLITISTDVVKDMLKKICNMANVSNWGCKILRDSYGQKMIFPWQNHYGLHIWYYCPGQLDDSKINEFIEEAIKKLGE